MSQRSRNGWVLPSCVLALGVIASAPERAASTAIPVVDLAQDLASRTVEGPPPLVGPRGQATVRGLREGNVTGVMLPLHEPRPGAPLDISQETEFQDLDRWFSVPGDFHFPGCRPKSDEIRTWLELDGGAEIALQPDKIGLWVTRGVRVFRIVGDQDDALATSWNDPPPGPLVGLTALGTEIVRRIHREGGLVDISSGSATMRQDVMSLAREVGAPVVAISSNARAKADDPHNLTDSELRGVGESGGVVAISLDERRIARGHAATLHDLIRQIIYVAKTVGIDHVAIGSGYEGIHPPDGLETAARFPALARGLLSSGVQQEDVESIFFRNALRVLCSPAKVRR